MSKILRLNTGFVLKLTVFYFIGISSREITMQRIFQNAFTEFRGKSKKIQDLRIY
ncbi:hypothetical protein LEP1GSC062_1065 [Leptospira alexanderi serovar Manhao 3 str. L 60]|uniref:Uncharacterized protein n=1 Tax=Leptospira alexanderi serovar Manhao 3 str. L 60 TaxID=1049759 RepID=V6IEH8_9LEPT|nr:hypothetical protein LEP1GSC062_1065 [Leptospira alexanderi serovar Manhao 3 str. L 60]